MFNNSYDRDVAKRLDAITKRFLNHIKDENQTPYITGGARAVPVNKEIFIPHDINLNSVS
jgi:hypothetical protein